MSVMDDDEHARRLARMDRDTERRARKFRRRMRAEAIEFAVAARKAGLPIDRVSAAGIALTLGAPEPATKEATLTPLEAWKAKRCTFGSRA
jgi:hypothetical protein